MPGLRSISVRIRVPGLVARMRSDENGATAVEFALIALPFFGLLFAIVQTSLVMFAGQVLQTMVSDVSRKIMTGQLANKDKAAFKAALCASPSMIMFKCEKLLLQVQSFADFSTANPSTFIEPDCFDATKAEGASCYNPGTASQVVIVRVAYPWPFGISVLEKNRTLVAVTAFRSEPY
jgi:Flp pilus assembly protein TadG